MKDQLEQNERSALPWIGVEPNSFIPIDSPHILWPQLFPNPSIRIAVNFGLKNYGTEPAFHVDTRLTWDAVPDIERSSRPSGKHVKSMPFGHINTS